MREAMASNIRATRRAAVELAENIESAKEAAARLNNRVGRDDDDHVLSFREWCARAGLSEATGRRMVARGEGPKITHVSTRRITLFGNVSLFSIVANGVCQAVSVAARRKLGRCLPCR
jgi:hypothetical protein